MPGRHAAADPDFLPWRPVIMQPSTLITIPCHNEEIVLERNIERLHEFCREKLDRFAWRLLIADNNSGDRTATIGRALAARLDQVGYAHLEKKGRGHSLRRCWLDYPADVYAYMDADLATELQHLPPLLDAIRDGAAVAIGTRLAAGSQVRGRTPGREISSRGYNLCLQLLLRAKFHDAQCGFKAVSRRVRDEILPLTRDDHWFFDSEVLLLAGRKQWPIREIPVVWEDHQARDSKVRLFRDILYFLRQMAAFRRRLWFDPNLKNFLRNHSFSNQL